MDEDSVQLPATPVDTLQMFHFEELIGEAMFLDLHSRESDSELRLKLAHLAHVEAENALWLRRHLMSAGLSVGGSEDAVRAGRDLARGNFKAPWPVNFRMMRDRLAEIHIPRFQTYLAHAEARGVAVEISACQLMVDHDIAFFEFADREIAGLPLEQVLQPLKARLRFPLVANPGLNSPAGA